MKFSVLGSGRWGSFIAWYLDKIGNDVILWGRPNSGKMQKARKLGIPIKTYGEFGGNTPQVQQKENKQEFDFNSESLF